MTLVMASDRHPGALCACGHDILAEPWFTVDVSAQQTPYCRPCSLSYWGMSSSDFVVTILTDDSDTMGSSLGNDDPSTMHHQGPSSTALRLSGLLNLTLVFLTCHTCSDRQPPLRLAHYCVPVATAASATAMLFASYIACIRAMHACDQPC